MPTGGDVIVVVQAATARGEVTSWWEGAWEKVRVLPARRVRSIKQPTQLFRTFKWTKYQVLKENDMMLVLWSSLDGLMSCSTA